MLIRAIFISALLHLALLVSPTLMGEPGRRSSGGQNADAVSMRLVQRAGVEVASTDVGKTVFPETSSQVSRRQPKAPPEAPKNDFDFGRFLPSTVGMAKSGSEMQSVRPIAESAGESMVVSEVALGEYRLNVARSARPFKVYPNQARENGWEGVAHVAVALPSGPGAPVVSLRKSSGYAVLDRQALEMLERGVGLAKLPEGLRGKGVAISLPVEFSLAD